MALPWAMRLLGFQPVRIVSPSSFQMVDAPFLLLPVFYIRFYTPNAFIIYNVYLKKTEKYRFVGKF